MEKTNKSDASISVLSGVDGLIINVPPVHSWGHRFVLMLILTKSCGYVYRENCWRKWTRNLGSTTTGCGATDRKRLNVLRKSDQSQEGGVVTLKKEQFSPKFECQWLWTMPVLPRVATTNSDTKAPQNMSSKRIQWKSAVKGCFDAAKQNSLR